jgi:hypothetical protein
MMAQTAQITAIKQPGQLVAGVPQLVTLAELAKLWALPLTWLRESCRSRCTNDPLPVFRLGRYVRVDMADPALLQWLQRRAVKR